MFFSKLQCSCAYAAIIHISLYRQFHRTQPTAISKAHPFIAICVAVGCGIIYGISAQILYDTTNGVATVM